MSSKTVQMSFRFPIDKQRAIARMSKATEMTQSDVVRQLVPTDLAFLQEIVNGAQNGGPESIKESSRELMADGLRWRMMRAGIEPAVLDQLSSQGVLHYWDEFNKAIQYRIGMLVPEDGQLPEYRIETPPAGGQWEQAGQMGQQVLGSNERFTADGIEHGVRFIEVPPEGGDR